MPPLSSPGTPPPHWPQPLSRTSQPPPCLTCVPLHLPLPFSASPPACISILPGPQPPRLGLTSLEWADPATFLLSAGLGPSSRETPAFMPEEERRAEGSRRRLDGERAWGERRSGAPAHRRGFSGPDKDASRKEDFSARFPRRPRNPRCLLHIYPRTPSPPPPGVGVSGKGAVDGAWGGGVFWVLCTPLTSLHLPGHPGHLFPCLWSVSRRHTPGNKLVAGRGRRGPGMGAVTSWESPARGASQAGPFGRARRLFRAS